jgi:hypothetical protein
MNKTACQYRKNRAVSLLGLALRGRIYAPLYSGTKLSLALLSAAISRRETNRIFNVVKIPASERYV